MFALAYHRYANTFTSKTQISCNYDSRNDATAMAVGLVGRHNFFSAIGFNNPNIMDRKDKERRETPIVDGDARPDMPVDTDKLKEKQGEKAPGNKKFESERNSDMNSLEDYKDAK